MTASDGISRPRRAPCGRPSPGRTGRRCARCASPGLSAHWRACARTRSHSASLSRAPSFPRTAECGHPVADDREVVLLVEGVEREPEPEALAQRDLLLDRLGLVDLGPDVAGVEVFAHVLRHEVPAVRGRVEEHVVRRRADGTVQDRLQRLVARLVCLEGEIVAEQDEPLGARFQRLHEVRKGDEVVLVDLDQAQALRLVLVQQRLDERRLARAPGTGEQHVVRGMPTDELPGYCDRGPSSADRFRAGRRARCGGGGARAGNGRRRGWLASGMPPRRRGPCRGTEAATAPRRARQAPPGARSGDRASQGRWSREAPAFSEGRDRTGCGQAPPGAGGP